MASSAKLATVESDSLQKQERLFAALRGIDSLLVAFSGGADSAYLAWAAHQVLGQRALAVTALSASFSRHDREQAEAFVRSSGVRHQFIETHEFQNPLYVANNADRCYHCKDELFDRMALLAKESNFSAIAYGINADDTRDFRPGQRAAKEHSVLAPLADAGLTKIEIRALAKAAGYPLWDRPAAPCLSSRVEYGRTVTREVLSQVEQAEESLRQLGFRELRVRHHGQLARVELARTELPRALAVDMLDAISAALKKAGFEYVTLDCTGFRSGSMNAILPVEVLSRRGA